MNQPPRKPYLLSALTNCCPRCRQGKLFQTPNAYDLKNYMKDPNSGAGLERCVYELNEWQFCMSPLIESQYVMEVKGVLVVRYKEPVPSRDPVTAQIITEPYHIIAFPKATVTDVRFQKVE